MDHRPHSSQRRRGALRGHLLLRFRPSQVRHGRRALAHCGMDYDIAWKQAGDGLDLGLVGLPIPAVAGDMQNETAFIQRHWTRIDGNGGSTPEP